ncbi:MAG TPA: iron-containing alcohol dehydrogenase [Candidatus Polarisedimenticolia bacterium]|jgi:alcohol dehydrogenase
MVIEQVGQWSASIGPTRVVFGAGALNDLGRLARDLGGTGALLVTDAGLRAAGHAGRAERSLAGAGLRVSAFDGVAENPTTRHVEEGARFALPLGIDLIVGLGGGSAMDCARGINFLLTQGGRMEDFWGTNRAVRPMLASIGVPTTAGTGSEAQSYALIEQDDSRLKMACGDEKARFRIAILDPDLTATTPPRVAAAAGMDAISHAVESFVSTRRNPLSSLFAREAWRLLSSSLSRALGDPSDQTSRERMLLGAHLAGAAIEASMLGAAHACANPLTSRYGVPHGEAVLLMLPHVVRFNEPVAGPLYADLMGETTAASAGDLADHLVDLRRMAGLRSRLRDAGVAAASLPSLAVEASEQWTAGFNPRPVTRQDLQVLYETAY